MFKRCLVCNTPFPENQTLERFPTGDRVAYDPGRGRLWAVCRPCGRWSLAPIEERWEALEELEKAVRDQGRSLSRTDNIELIKVGPMEIVRVGRAELPEEAWWRYGRELTARRDRYKKLALAGSLGTTAVVMGGMAALGVGVFGMYWGFAQAPEWVTSGARWLRFGGAAWRGSESCAWCGHDFKVLRFRDRRGFLLVPGSEEGATDLVARCPRCGHSEDGGLRLSGATGEKALRRVLAFDHHKGATKREVQSATRLIEEAGSATQLTRLIVQGGRRLGDIQRTGALGLEIAANERAEQLLLELELVDLEATWREEEELASIMDDELTPLPFVEKLRIRVSGQA